MSDWRNKGHFLAMAATQMRRVLVDHAKRRNAAKRGGGLRRVTLDESLALSPDQSVDLLTIDQALRSLVEERHQRMIDAFERAAKRIT